MKSLKIKIVFLTLLFSSLNLSSQDFIIGDTLVDIGTHKINFSIVKGGGIPILFESGASNDGTVWHPILEEIYNQTGATLITYDRAGFGKSTIDTLNEDLSEHGIISGIEDLEFGLKHLGYDREIMLVSHSYGGYFTYLYVFRNPEKVKSIVAIDIVHDYHAKGFAEKLVARMKSQIVEWKRTNEGMYYLLSTLPEAAKIITDIYLPPNIPVVDILMSAPFSEYKEESDRWVYCHEKFVESHPNAKGIPAENTGHFIWRHNPSLIILTIIKSYADVSVSEISNNIYKNVLEFAIDASNQSRKKVYSEYEINSWAYSFLNKDEIKKALEIFKLNIILYPESFNVYDSYGEALLKADNKEEAIKMYKKSVELNPENENGISVLKEILNK